MSSHSANVSLLFLYAFLVSDVQKRLSKFPSRSPTALCQGILRGSSNTCHSVRIHDQYPSILATNLAFCGAFPSATSAMSAKTFTKRTSKAARLVNALAASRNSFADSSSRMSPRKGFYSRCIYITSLNHIKSYLFRIHLFHSISWFYFILCFSFFPKGPSQKFQPVEGVQKCLAQSILGGPKARPATLEHWRWSHMGSRLGHYMGSHLESLGVTWSADLCSNSSSAETSQQRCSCFLSKATPKPHSEWSHPGCMP